MDAAAQKSNMTIQLCMMFSRHVLQPAQQAFARVDVFGHSWTPSVGALLDALYQPRASRHEEPPESAALRSSCGSSWHKHPLDCERTRSQLLGMRRAIALKARAEASKPAELS